MSGRRALSEPETLVIIDRWPARMRKETAAAYVDAVSPRAFDEAVRKGVYPRPRRIKGEGLRWLKSELDEAIAKPGGAANDDFEDLS
ncbi:hypothetical protein [Henriciella aquimarina]|uniref:hypothetical protein n=1 Tax=Henriciella aquimarina TaxID=545261 RepID=UPI000A04C87A|nr:hypothetical protein [Henriciella aquimarina]